MQIRVNGSLETIPFSLSIKEYLLNKGLKPESVVIELNGQVVKREQWEKIVLKENDELEVLRFVGGG
ncbi:MAG: sulfur carrier protein ThiS [Bacillota bacterium]|uniref:Sulfur carrier protein ThiS n=1 Tax=Thermanaerosceptrum fracticalcis TaxID=1712410 RepID=A0A7G6E7T4_THEFR|nr:sulfur carrier protein ThiS [Thermanaerosceptrum fracticalcis]QNB48138.1 sulfur carrier protein ThiS [Thermanaerosceptrum fracticalcis]